MRIVRPLSGPRSRLASGAYEFMTIAGLLVENLDKWLIAAPFESPTPFVLLLAVICQAHLPLLRIHVVRISTDTSCVAVNQILLVLRIVSEPR